MNCIIIDDDLMARLSLARLCAKIPALTVLAICENATVAAEAILTHQPDLLFLDVEMPDKTGLELLDNLPVLPQVIMTTSKTEYAFAAFSYRVTDYLKKPIDFPRFRGAVEKALAMHDCVPKNQLSVAELPKTPPSVVEPFETPFSSIFLRTEGRYLRVNVEDVLYFENIGDYVKVCTKSGNHTIHSTMKALDEKLQHPQLVKVHRSFIVNLGKIVDIEENSLVIERKVIPISRAHKAGLMARLNVI